MTNEFKTRQDIIQALVEEFSEKESSFNNNEKTKSREKFWTYNRLFHYYHKKKQASISNI